jgi:hypothetical protein
MQPLKDNSQIDNNPYKFEDITNQNGLLDNSIDATYIIYLEGNEERRKNIKNQLELFHTSKQTHILNNKGFKKCNKNLKEQTPRCDLIDCFMQVFKHAEEKNYNNILILEDDFQFSEKIKEQSIINEINSFVNLCSERNLDFIYLLGCVPYLQIPSFINKHTRLLLSTGTHSSIYSRKFRENILKTEQATIDDWDLYTNFNNPNTYRYIYKEPLCYQLFYETDNFNSWDGAYNFKYFIMSIYKYFNMNNSPEPGFSYFYLISKLIFIIIAFIIYFVLKYTIKLIISPINKLKNKSFNIKSFTHQST